MNTFEPLGAKVSVRHEPEAYYDRWERLRNKERRLAKLANRSKDNAERWVLASRQLVALENMHYEFACNNWFQSQQLELSNQGK